jgi:hypothetical protein
MSGLGGGRSIFFAAREAACGRSRRFRNFSHVRFWRNRTFEFGGLGSEGPLLSSNFGLFLMIIVVRLIRELESVWPG